MNILSRLFSRTATVSVPALDAELFDAFESGRLEPKNVEQGDWYAGVKSGRIAL